METKELVTKAEIEEISKIYNEHYKGKVVIDVKTIQDFLFTSETKLNDKQKAMFMQLAIRHQLDPFRREIFAIPFGPEFNVVTGYQVYVQRAEATGLLDGWECNSLANDKGELIGAKITIYRKDFAHPFIWEVAFKEFDKKHSNWKVMPEFMIKKVCIGQGFRLAFPNELGGMPYLAEELEGLQPASAIKPPQPKTQTEQPAGEQAAETQTITTGIEKVETKAGTTKAGKPWTKYIIHAGETYSTFSKTFADEAQKASETGLWVILEFKVSTYGNEVVNLKIQEPTGGESRSPGEEG